MRPFDITEDSNHAGADQFDGFSIRETGGAAATEVEFRVAAVDGQILAVCNLAAGESATLVMPRSIDSDGGVYVKTTGTGVLAGVFYGD